MFNPRLGYVVGGMNYEEVFELLTYYWEQTNDIYEPEEAVHYWGTNVVKIFHTEPFLANFCVKQLICGKR